MKNTPLLLTLGIFWMTQVLVLLGQTEIPEALRSPVNHVYQFEQDGECSLWADGSKTSARAYLWIPETCKKLRGLLILCANCPEQMLAGHPQMREICTNRDLGIVWCPSSFFNFKAKNEIKTDVAFLQQLLDGLATSSGYPEVATVPWLPLGESGHLLMVDALVEAAPERCLAGIWIKNCHLPPKNREVPAFVLYGSAQEWSQDKSDIRTNWNNIDGAYAGILQQRKSYPNWPLSFVIDGTSGHFECSERLTRLIIRYVDFIAKARLSDDGSPTLKKIDLNSGYLADLPVPGHENQPIRAFSEAPVADQAFPWYCDQAFAQEAQSIAKINWKSETQLPAFVDKSGNVFPMLFNGITMLSVNKAPVASPDGSTPSLIETEPDGITFTLKGVLLDTIPKNFANAGERLSKTPGDPSVEWLCGAIEPLGNHQFRFAIDRTWPSPLYVVIRQPGSETIRAVAQPCQITRDSNSEGTAQKITFQKIDDVKVGTVSIPLKATADSGLPVRFFVDSGPAIIKEDQLVFTAIPPNTKFPVAVTVGAWQWGRYQEPKIKRAEVVKQKFLVQAP